MLSKAADVTMILYDMVGRQRAVILQQWLEAGEHQYKLNGEHLSSGVYYLEIKAGESRQVQKITLIR